jgi:hypothetical protein
MVKARVAGDPWSERIMTDEQRLKAYEAGLLTPVVVRDLAVGDCRYDVDETGDEAIEAAKAAHRAKHGPGRVVVSVKPYDWGAERGRGRPV